MNNDIEKEIDSEELLSDFGKLDNYQLPISIIDQDQLAKNDYYHFKCGYRAGRLKSIEVNEAHNLLIEFMSYYDSPIDEFGFDKQAEAWLLKVKSYIKRESLKTGVKGYAYRHDFGECLKVVR